MQKQRRFLNVWKVLVQSADRPEPHEWFLISMGQADHESEWLTHRSARTKTGTGSSLRGDCPPFGPCTSSKRQPSLVKAGHHFVTEAEAF